MFGSGFALVIQTAWDALDIVIFPAGSFGQHDDITLFYILLFSLGAVMLIKFVRYCMGGNFNEFTEKVGSYHEDLYSFNDRLNNR